MRYQTQINLGIKQLRAEHNLTQEKFAESIGVTVEAVRNLERNRHAPTGKTIDSICQAFNIRPVDLLLDKNPDENSKIKKLICDKINSSTTEELQMINELVDIVRKNYLKINKSN